MSQYLRETLMAYGPQTLSTADLLALVLRTGATRQQDVELAQHLLEKYGGLSELAHVDCKELVSEPGLGDVIVIRMKVILELAKRLNKPREGEKYQIRMPSDAAKFVMGDLSWLDHEEMRILILDTKSRVMDNVVLYRGTVNSTVVRAGEIFRLAIVRKAVSIIVCHCHPSGDIQASSEDIAVTQQLVAAGQYLDIELRDHLIIGNGRFLSLRDQLRW
jgi:DNA repair protein RadC